MASFQVSDRRGIPRDRSGRRVPLPGATASVPTRRVTQEQQDAPSSGGLPFQTPDAAFAGRKMASTMRRTAQYGGSGYSSIQMATSRPRDPMWYWKQNNIPFDFTSQEEMGRIREFCTTPDTLVLMADNSVRPISTVAVGDKVWGWTYRMKPNGGMERRYTESVVEATATFTQPIQKMTMASGAVIQCTPDHLWANPDYTKVDPQPRYYPLTQNLPAKEYYQAAVGTELLSVAMVQTGHDLRGYQWWIGVSNTGGNPDKVISIEAMGTGTVCSLQTSTGNYIAGGYASKNCRLLYVTHPIVSACIDVYSKLPMQGMHFECKDAQLIDFYSDLFFDQLNYEDFLLDLGTEYWLSGESWALGGWNDALGVWEAESLVNPDDVEVESALFSPEPRYLMRLPESLRQILTSRTPHWQYTQLVNQFPELVQYADEDSLMPVSGYVLKQMRFKADRFSNRGIPILMRGFRTIIQEEMLNSALDSIADRLYTPLILTKLGATAADLGTNVPWIPTQEDMEEFNIILDAALAADFRALTYHWAIDMQTVFGRENVPDLTNDFDRIVERILMVFGLSQTMLTGANAGETYAADALNRDVVTQLLSHYQRMQTRFVHDRAAIVAEAQEHFDYEVRGGKRYLITEEIYEIDEETGEERVIEQPKLLIPDLEFKTLNISDEETERQFVESLAAAGVPIPYRNRLTTTGIDFDEAVEQRSIEDVALAVAEQETRKKTFQALQRAGLPIASDLAQDFSPKAIQPGAEPEMGYNAQDMMLPGLGQNPVDTPGLAPTADEMAQDAMQEEQDPNMPADDQTNEPFPDNPEESDEQREGMPKAAKLQKISGYGFQRLGIREVTAKHYVEPDNSHEEQLSDYQPTGKFGTPQHVGMRKHLHVGDIPTRVARKGVREDDTEDAEEG